MGRTDRETKPSAIPFDRHLVMAERLEMGPVTEDRFYVVEFDLTKDDIGPMTKPIPVTEVEVEARARLAQLGLSESEIEGRLTWAKSWMTTRTISTD
jgi:hypothetical protein